MSKYLLTIALLAVFNLFSSSQTFNWVKHNSVNINSNPSFALFTSNTDPSGNLIITSNLNSKVQFLNWYFGDVVLVKYDNSGNQIWSKFLNGKAVINGVQADGSGNIYIYGLFMDTLIIEPGNFLFNTGFGFDLNSFIIKFNTSAGFVWKKNVTAIYGNSSFVSAFKVKSNFLLAGLFTDNFVSSVLKFDLNGTELASFIQSPVRTLSALDADASGNIFAAGSCGQGNIQFSNTNVNCPYVYSLYFAKYNPSNSSQWIKLVEDATFQAPNLVCDNQGNAVAAGDMFIPYVFDTIHTQGPSWVFDFFVTKINTAGNFLWAREVPNDPGGGDASIGIANNVAIDNQNNIYITGFQRGTINWGNFSTTGSLDVLILKYNANGNPIWGKTSVSPNDCKGQSVSLDNSGNVFVSGYFQQSIQFDTIAISTSNNLSYFAAKMSNPPLGIIGFNNIEPSGYTITSFPNPFNPVTTISYNLTKAEHVNLIIYDITGNEIEVLVNGNQPEGTYEIEWNPEKNSSGIYFARLSTGDFTKTIKMMLVK